MMSRLRRWTCRWAIRRIQVALDDDGAARLPAPDLERLMVHLGACRDCFSMVEDYLRLAESLARLSRRSCPDPATFHRLRLFTARLMTEESL